MQTAAISYRVADFLKSYPPFQFMDETDLLALAAHGRVKFHEVDEYLCWQDAVPGPYVFVVQQGAVSLWETTNGQEYLRDIRGAGDMVGIERFAGAEKYLFSAKATSDVVVYALNAADFEAMLAKYAEAGRYIASQASVAADYQGAGPQPSAHQLFVHDLAGDRPPLACHATDTIRDAARRMSRYGARAIAVVDGSQNLLGMITSDAVLRWVAEDGDLAIPVRTLMHRDVCVIPSHATVSQCVLAMADAKAEVAALTEDGSPCGRLLNLIGANDLAPAFGDQPTQILRDIPHAHDTASLRRLAQRSRAFALDQLRSPGALDWLARFVNRIDMSVLRRVLDLTGAAARVDGCWVFYGAAGRGELLSAVMPQIAVILPDGEDASHAASAYRDVIKSLEDCGYLSLPADATELSFACANLSEWTRRFTGWVRNPVLTQVYQARPLFDLHPVYRRERLWQSLATGVKADIQAEKNFVRLLAHDCMASFPPLTFFRDAVVEETGEHTHVFHLETNALLPLVDVGRVFGLAAGRGLGGSTLERFALAKTLLPEHESIFREASETLRVVLYHQARAGIRQHSDGADLEPALLSRHDRQVLKNGFRSIHRLLEFSAECRWLDIQGLHLQALDADGLHPRIHIEASGAA
jgi:CBS domain-containing protein